MLYSTYRPQTFKEVSGQEQNLVTLREQAKTKNYDSAYIFAGHRGTGKTTLARILSRVICCESPTADGPCNQCVNCNSMLKDTTLDCIELDAASHNSINDIKELIASTKYTPTVLPKKIYIIDEVHNLSGSAFDALLKTIEEPPKHCIFILCTTELHKIPATIRSRCSIYQFNALSTGTIRGRLTYVLQELQKEYDEDAVNLIARQADGSMRDALSIMEKLMISCSRLTVEHVKKCLCLMDDEVSLEMLSAVIKNDSVCAIRLLWKIYEEGKSLSLLVDNILHCLVDGIVLYISSGETALHRSDEHLKETSHISCPSDYELRPSGYQFQLYQIVRDCRTEQLYWYVEQFSILREKIRDSLNPYMDVLIYIIKCCTPKLLRDSESSLLARISELEQSVAELQENIDSTVSSTDGNIQIRDSSRRETSPEPQEKEDTHPANDGSVEIPSPVKTDEASLPTENPDGLISPSLMQESPISPIETAADDYDVLGLLSDYL